MIHFKLIAIRQSEDTKIRTILPNFVIPALIFIPKWIVSSYLDLEIRLPGHRETTLERSSEL